MMIDNGITQITAVVLLCTELRTKNTPIDRSALYNKLISYMQSISKLEGEFMRFTMVVVMDFRIYYGVRILRRATLVLIKHLNTLSLPVSSS